LLGEFVAGVVWTFLDLPPGIVDTEGLGASSAVLAYALIYVEFSWNGVRRILAKPLAWLRRTFEQPF
jgi:hypothetical protein